MLDSWRYKVVYQHFQGFLSIHGDVLFLLLATMSFQPINMYKIAMNSAAFQLALPLVGRCHKKQWWNVTKFIYSSTVL